MLKRVSSILICLTYFAAFTAQSNKIIDCRPGAPFPWKFLGNQQTSINANNPTATFSHHCFKTTTVTWGGYNDDKTEAYLTFDSKDPATKSCTDSILVHNLYGFEVKTRLFVGTTTLTYKIKKSRGSDYIDKNGLRIVPFCAKWFNLLPNIMMTLETFLVNGISLSKYPKMADFLEDQNYYFQQRFSGRKVIKRRDPSVLDEKFLEKNIRSGDVYCDNWASGLGLLIHMGTGAECEHNGIFLWGRGEDEGVLFMVESNPPAVRKKKFRDWYGYDFDHSTALTRLRPELSAKFDADKAWDFIDKHIGTPYGFENFFFSWVDTPDASTPQLFDLETFSLIFSIGSDILGADYYIDLMISKALNHRLGTTGLGFKHLIDEWTKRGMTLGEVMAIPEKPDWKYFDGKLKQYGSRWICSALVIKILQEGTVLESDITAQEFTPRDVWELGIYEEMTTLDCKKEDPYQPFCVMTGRYGFDYEKYNSIKPYPHMNERCPSKAPFFVRKEGC